MNVQPNSMKKATSVWGPRRIALLISILYQADKKTNRVIFFFGFDWDLQRRGWEAATFLFYFFIFFTKGGQLAFYEKKKNNEEWHFSALQLQHALHARTHARKHAHIHGQENITSAYHGLVLDSVLFWCSGRATNGSRFLFFYGAGQLTATAWQG
jgi:hypothetical protein